MTNEIAEPIGQAAPVEEAPQVIEAANQLSPTDEQRAWPRVRLAPAGAARLIRADTGYSSSVPTARQLLEAVAGMLAAGSAVGAEAIFAHVRAAGVSLKTEFDADGTLRVTAVRN